jgi:thioredoxin-related protein
MLFSTAMIYAQNEGVKDLYEWRSLKEAQKLADENNKKVLVYANASWCTFCKKMEKEVFTSKTVQEKTAKDFYPVWIDIESQDSLTFRGDTMTQAQFARTMRVTGTPTFVFFGPDGEIIAGQPGFIPEKVYVQILDYIGSDAYLKQSFEEYAESK